MNQIKEGTSCWINGNASRDTLKVWNKYRSKGLPLTCPCHCLSQELVVLKILAPGLVLLKFKERASWTIAYTSNLTTLKPETI